jgi:pimeloyl-ACP methyl ester carboxylesterase
MPLFTPWRFSTALLLVLLTAAPAPADPRPLEFRVAFDSRFSDKPFTGRVYVVLSRKELKGMPGYVNWFAPEPFFARDVRDWQSETPLVIGGDALACPAPLKSLKPGTYSVVAVMDRGRGMSFTHSEGNGYSRPIRLELDPARSGPIALHIDQLYREPPFPETDRVKYVEVESKLLSDFHGRPVRLRAGVALPKSFRTHPERRYPILYEIPGMGGDHFMVTDQRTDVDGVEFVYVMLDANCPLGHHVFADSANNGPCDRALVEELIPVIEQRYRAVGTPATRLLTGHSSGGWSSLWLQITYPDFFGGVWSTAPDPVDFRDFQLINIYQPGMNTFIDAEGKPRPIARARSRPVLFFKPFSDMEEVMGHGGQLLSFEAVFSPRGADGRPRPLWDRRTGTVDPVVAREWEKYDIRLVLERNWKTLGPRLAGKIHVYTGDEDTYYLDGPTRLLRQSLKALGSDAVVELFPGKTHFTLLSDRALVQRIAREMADQVRKAQK